MNCLFCKSGNLKTAAFPRDTTFNNKVFSYKQCIDCGLVFINPLLTDDDYTALYKKEYHEEFYFEARKIRNDHFVDAVTKYKTSGKVLDYGCGDGWLLKAFENKGFEGYGVEYNPALVETLQERYPNMHFQTIAKLEDMIGDGVDVVHLGDVLEHLVDPGSVVEKIKRLLHQGGILVVQGPLENNTHFALWVRKLISAIQGKKLSHHKPYHVTFATAKNQLQFFESNGFQTLDYNLFETAWPYPETVTAGSGNFVKYWIARLSILISSILPGKMGNRFIYIGVVKIK